MSSRKLKKELKQKYGVLPDFHYFEGDMTSIRKYFDYRYDNQLDDFLIDDTTWNDLSGDEIYKHINQGLSTSGEQYLYYLLRSPTIKQDEYDKRARLIEIMEENPDVRLKLQVIFTKLGRRRAANTCEVFSPSSHSSKKIFLYIFIVLAFLGSAVSLVFTTEFVLLFIGLLIAIPMYRSLANKHIESDLATVNYSVAMVYTAKRIMKLDIPELKPYLSSCYEALSRVKSISRVGYIPQKGSLDVITELLSIYLMLDFILYEYLKNRLGKHHKDIFHLHEHLGHLDSAIAIASYRKSLPSYTKPQIDFTSSVAYFRGIGLVHPLIKNAVPNDFDTEKSMLLTGSNASGKSTFLKTVALNAIFAQSICTVLAGTYEAPTFRIYTSMAITDDLLAGESYFISEIKSLKRIVDTDTSKQPLLCVIDEVLRGTNTVERIAASSEILRHLAEKNSLCLAATHDIELCSLLNDYYRMMHFSEKVTEDGEVLFDYMIKSGPTTTRNAIKLLSSMGFDKALIKRANEKANRFTIKGKWKLS